jgi:hypothetical protein
MTDARCRDTRRGSDPELIRPSCARIGRATEGR